MAWASLLGAFLLGCAGGPSFNATSRHEGQAVRLEGELFRPPGSGPFPAVVLLHGCSGVKDNHIRWGRLLARWGYVAYVLDSLGPRGLGPVCGKKALPAKTRAVDAYDAKAYLAGLPFVQPDAIALLGWSQGGMAVLWAADAAVARPTASFQAYVALYPGCRRDPAGLRAPLLILAGAKDDWTPAALCQRLAGNLSGKPGPPVEIKVYPEATHAWDRDSPPRIFRGHRLDYDFAATQDSQEMVRKFLGLYLKGGG